MKLNVTKEMNLKRSYLDSIKEMEDFLREKERSYGTHNLVEMGELGIYIRMMDKIGRLKRYYQEDEEPSLESVQDAWRDIAGYALQWLRFFGEEKNE